MELEGFLEKSNNGKNDKLDIGGLTFHYVRSSPAKRESYKCRNWNGYIKIVVVADGKIYSNYHQVKSNHNQCRTKKKGG